VLNYTLRLLGQWMAEAAQQIDFIGKSGKVVA
jgi:hypothetical protein